MGDYRIEIDMTGGHGCERTAKEGERTIGCGMMGCPDCETRAFVSRLRDAGNALRGARFVHWPGQKDEVVDERTEPRTRRPGHEDQGALLMAEPTTPSPPAEPLLQFFTFEHLREELRETSRAFSVLAHQIVDTLPRNQERTVSLRKLLEAKDCAVRARLMK
jgi:hypothetical protein